MKNILLFLLPLFISCTEKNSKSEKGIIKSNILDARSNNNNTPDTNQTSNQKTGLEFLDWDSLRINNRLPLLCKKRDLIELLGKPDSTVVPNMNDICTSYFETEFKYMYFGKSQFETRADTAVISSISFKKYNRIKINSGSIVLDNTMTIDKLASLFPNAVKLKEALYLDGEGKVMCVRLATSKVVSDNAWLLFFLGGKLIQIDFWMPC